MQTSAISFTRISFELKAILKPARSNKGMSNIESPTTEQLSAGVMCEMVYSMSLAKFVYTYYPFEPSPFFEWYTTKNFSDEKKMVKYLIDIAK